MITTLLLALTFAAPASDAAGTATPPTKSPQAVLQAKAIEIKALMGKKADDVRRAKLRDIVAEVVDYTELAKASLKSQWDGRTEAERTEFTELLRGLIEKSYLDNIGRQPDFTIEWITEKLLKGGAKAKVKTLATGGKTTIEIEYRMVAHPELASGWLVADLVVDEVSMVRNYRRSFKKIIKNDGWATLIKKMKDKLGA